MSEVAETTKRPLEAESPTAKKPRFTQRQRAERVVKESDVGITAYINDHGLGFYGSIKTLYADFLVNEIGPDGKVVHLTDEGIDTGKTKKEKKYDRRHQERAELQDKTPEEVEKIKEARRAEEEARKAEEESKPKYELSEEHRAQLLQQLTEHEVAEIEQLFTTGNKMETKTQFDDKQARGKLHQLLREAFQGKLETTTSASNTFQIMLRANSKNVRGAARPQESINHVDENGVVNYGLGPFKDYLHFTVYKENRETMEVANMISKFLRIPTKNVHFAGTKDRRGVTCQRFCIFRGKVVRVSTLNKGLKNAVLGGFTYQDNQLLLGDLTGNEFTITIRDVEPLGGASVEEVVDKCFDSLKNKGFINYYGMQRFGTFSISTHALGIHVLKSEWKHAVELILSEQEVVAPESIEARRVWAETGDAATTLAKLPRRFTAENCILTALLKEKKGPDGYSANAYFKALISIPRNLRLMYVHAYQSYVWNLVVSKRFELFGSEVQEGDLVLAEKEEKAVDDDFEEDVASYDFVRARPLSKEEAQSGQYSIFDVVLPLPGFDVIYPTNPQLKQVYVDAMAKDGLDPDNMARKVRDFSLAGSYRKILGKADNVSYDIVKYASNTDPLVRTDLELLRAQRDGTELPRVIATAAGDKTAVILRMQLSTSCYATMALREFMKGEIPV